LSSAGLLTAKKNGLDFLPAPNNDIIWCDDQRMNTNWNLWSLDDLEQKSLFICFLTWKSTYFKIGNEIFQSGRQSDWFWVLENFGIFNMKPAWNFQFCKRWSEFSDSTNDNKIFWCSMNESPVWKVKWHHRNVFIFS
jgi:hypothetical protein